MSAEHPSGKFKAAKPVPHAKGPTYTENDPAKFKGAGKTSGKTPANEIIGQKEGPTFTANRTHIDVPDADRHPPESKSRSEKAWFDPHSESKPVSTENETVRTNISPNGLKRDYDKKGAHGKYNPGLK
jgi:hypothetical protein